MTAARMALSGQGQVKQGESGYRVAIRVSTLGRMASTRDKFAAFLRAAMEAAGLPRAQDVEDATNKEVKMGTIYRWLRAEGDDDSELSPKRLRAVANVLGVPPLEMFVAAGLLSAEEAGFNGEPTPPARRSLEDDIRADPRFSPRRQETLIALIRELSEGEPSRTSVRSRRTDVSPDQGIDRGGDEELSG